MDTMTASSTTAADMVSVAEKISSREALGLNFGTEMNTLWFFIRNRSNVQVRRERDAIYRILQVVGRNHSERMTSYMVKHAEDQDLRLFWSQAGRYAREI